jgi:class 3 adenylate cyclase/dihydrofolate reductase
MGRLIAVEFMTLDGVMEAPGHDPHRDGKNAWALAITSEDQQEFSRDQMFSAAAILLGRTTYQIWAAFWPSAPREGGFADRINALPKYVASTTLKEAEWNNSTIISGNVPEEVSKLKEEIDGDILIYGSAELVNSLMGHKLIDEFRLLVFPVVLGSGKRLFRDESDTTHLRLIGSKTFESGVNLLTYTPADDTPSSKYVETYAWTREAVESLQAAQNVDRVLATILFTDIVESTAQAADLGDQRWRQLIDRHDRTARVEVERFNGTFIKSTGDGILATFDAPTRALRCAFGLGESLAKSGLDIRAAIHTGEIEMRDNDVGGIGVHIAARALAEAGGGQVVVTRTVRDLATGTDLAFIPLGSVGLKGVPGEWDLFEASIGAWSKT